MLERLFGKEAAHAFRAPFVLGELELLRSLCAEAGIRHAEAAGRPRSACLLVRLYGMVWHHSDCGLKHVQSSH
jgi:hypothetical protein